MQKTMYIPKGQECRFENLTCERIIVNGSLYVDGKIRARHIRGKGFIYANSIYAESVTADNIDACEIVSDRLIAARVTAAEIHAVQSMAVSCYIKAGYVKSAKMTIADADIDDLVSDEAVKLAVKRRGLLGTLFASFVSSKWARLFCRHPERNHGQTVNEEQTAEDTQSAEATSSGSVETECLMNDPEFLRLKAMFTLARETGYIWQLVSKEQPSDRVVTLGHQFAAPPPKAA